jgi:hypothetical protein
VERIPAWVLWLAAAIFAGLAIWSATDRNWSGLIVGLVLAGLCAWAATRRRTIG